METVSVNMPSLGFTLVEQMYHMVSVSGDAVEVVYEREHVGMASMAELSELARTTKPSATGAYGSYIPAGVHSAAS